MRSIRLPALCLLLGLAFVMPAAAQSSTAPGPRPDFWLDADPYGMNPLPGAPSQSVVHQSDDGRLRLEAGVGATFIEGNEYVYFGDDTISHLIWQTRAPMLRSSIELDLSRGFGVRAEGSIAGFASSYMEDYDWLGGNFAADAWTHRSQHPDTKLDHFLSGAASVGLDLMRDPEARIRLNAGLEYTDVKWTAYGGTFVSSEEGFRDTVETFDPDAQIIAYRQQFPQVFAGIEGETRMGQVRFGGMLRGGMTFFSRMTDDHFLGDLRFIDSIDPTPTFAIGADIGLALGSSAEVSVGARYNHIFTGRGRTEVFDAASDAGISTDPDSGGAALRSLELTAALRASF